MKILELVNRSEVIVHPYASIASIEDMLIHNAYIVIKEEGKFVGL